MKATTREFRIAVAAALFGFFLCYFLVGSTKPKQIPAPKMKVVASLSAPVQTNLPNAFVIWNVRTNTARPLPAAPAGYTYVVGPFGAFQPPRVDLFSSRYKAHIDLSDLE